MEHFPPSRQLGGEIYNRRKVFIGARGLICDGLAPDLHCCDIYPSIYDLDVNLSRDITYAARRTHTSSGHSMTSRLESLTCPSSFQHTRVRE